MDKKALDQDYQELKALLEQVPGAKEHMAQPHVEFAKKMFTNRIQKRITMSELAEQVGTTIDILVDIEWGNPVQNQDQEILKKIKEILDFD